MRKKIVVILCICFLTGLVSGCGSEENNLTEDNNTTAFQESSEPKTVDAAVSENDQTSVMEESIGEIVSSREESGWPHWKQAYLAKAEEIEAEYGLPMEYDLIYLDGDDIPELVAGRTGSWFILYTWKDGEIYELMHEGYGTHGRVYCYEPQQGIIEESVYDMVIKEKESDSYTIFYTIYHTVTEDMEIIEQYELSEECRETGSTYFYRDASMTESRKIEAEEFSSYIKENLPEISGRFDLEALRYLLENADDSSVHSSGYGNMAGEAVRSLLVTETYYDGEGVVTFQSQIKYEYDSDGNQIRVLLGHEDGTYYEYKYDDFGNLSEEVSYEHGVIISHVKYEYDEDGRKIKSLACFGDRSKMVSVYKYNYFGNMTMEATYSYYGEMVNKTSYLFEYGRGGNLIRRIFSKEDILEGTEEYVYDDSNNLIQKVSYDAEGNALWFCVYDDSGNLIQEVSCDAEGNTLWFYGYEYDENGNMVEETTLSYIKKYEYDEQNNKTKEIYYLIDGSIAHYVEWTYEWLVRESNRNKQYLCKKVEEGYELTIYNSSDAIILSEVYPKEPGISWVSENVIEIAISVGSPARYVYYVDLEEDIVSDVYFNPILVGDEYVAYMEDDRKLILSDIFYTGLQEDLLYMTIVRDFTETANPMSAIMGIDLIDSENIELTYLIGENYIEVTEIIPLDNGRNK